MVSPDVQHPISFTALSTARFRTAARNPWFNPLRNRGPFTDCDNVTDAFILIANGALVCACSYDIAVNRAAEYIKEKL